MCTRITLFLASIRLRKRVENYRNFSKSAKCNLTLSQNNSSFINSAVDYPSQNHIISPVKANNMKINSFSASTTK